MSTRDSIEVVEHARKLERLREMAYAPGDNWGLPEEYLGDFRERFRNEQAAMRFALELLDEAAELLHKWVNCSSQPRSQTAEWLKKIGR